ncbi:MAG: hypothetical protein ACJ78R_04425 [Gemmatimonadaceae bacterium]
MRILRGLSSKWLACECLVGIYETYDGLVVMIVDAKGTGCADSSHRTGHIIPRALLQTENNPAPTNAS